jgi:carbonic anhydrase
MHYGAKSKFFYNNFLYLHKNFMDNYDKVFEQNKEWVEKTTSSDPDFFKKIYEGQNPDYLYIGCSDSRVPANEITGLDIGDLFVHRNIANQVPPNDLSSHSVLQYAIEILKVKHILVCGHYGCGGVHEAMQPHSYGELDNWLRNIRDVYRMHFDELDSIKNEEDKYDRLVELNTLEQCVNIIKTSQFQQSYIKNKGPIVHACIWDMRTGFLKDLNFQLEKELIQVQKIYNLTENKF